MKKSVVSLFAGIIALASIQSTEASPFSLGDLVVLQVGDGSAVLSSAATVGFLQEFSTSGGSALQTISLPTSISGSQLVSTFSGTATSEGQLLLSGDGHYLTFGGYNAVAGTASITTSAASAVNRVIGVVDASGSVDTSTAINTGITTGNPRSAISSDGNQLWLATSANGVNAITKGTVGAGTQLSTTPANTRVGGIFAGQLYVSAASGAFQGVASIGSGEPTTSGQTTTLLNGFPTASGPSPYDFFFANPNTIYVADDRTTVGGIQKWTLSAGTWTLAYTLTPAAGVGARSLAVDMSGASPIIYAITTANTLVSITDGGVAATGQTILETAAANTAFRGVAFAPTAVPEPTTLALATLGGLAGLVAMRRKR